MKITVHIINIYSHFLGPNLVTKPMDMEIVRDLNRECGGGRGGVV
jgi:hypothetical protein